MTKDELKALVASKLEGQGNQTDISGALSVVLNELIDGMGGGSDGGEWKYIPYEVLIQQAIVEMPLSEFLTLTGWTREELENLANGKYRGIFYEIPNPESPVTEKMGYHLTLVASAISNVEGQYGGFIVAGRMNENFGASMEIFFVGSSYEDVTVTLTLAN